MGSFTVWQVQRNAGIFDSDDEQLRPDDGDDPPLLDVVKKLAPQSFGTRRHVRNSPLARTSGMRRF